MHRMRNGLRPVVKKTSEAMAVHDAILTERLIVTKQDKVRNLRRIEDARLAEQTLRRKAALILGRAARGRKGPNWHARVQYLLIDVVDDYPVESGSSVGIDPEDAGPLQPGEPPQQDGRS